MADNENDTVQECDNGKECARDQKCPKDEEYNEECSDNEKRSGDEENEEEENDGGERRSGRKKRHIIDVPPRQRSGYRRDQTGKLRKSLWEASVAITRYCTKCILKFKSSAFRFPFKIGKGNVGYQGCGRTNGILGSEWERETLSSLPRLIISGADGSDSLPQTLVFNGV
ncbi:hypothetical protein WN51_14474 [Melipona quadrifasciata]|uniref:Uncharacterized protein n=1 Tax=Melipona quadrifasciata TaxID=166423 RepID=A0A0N0U4Y0_9HYME|nr:hypothetical protein WN51_14474 [Melipona quadrifasciata]